VVRRGQEELVIDWLPNVHITGEETFTSIVNKTLPILMRALVRSKGEKAADIQALVGWAHSLEARERGITDTDVPGLYRRALELDPQNPYANTFLGHWLLTEKGDLAGGMDYFAKALSSGRHREFVRSYEWGGLLNYLRTTSTGSPEHIEARKAQLKMLSSMLENDEPWLTGGSRAMPWEAIDAYGRPHRPDDDWFEEVWPVLTPEQHLRLVGEAADQVGESDFQYLAARYLLGRIHEKGGQKDLALACYRELDQELGINSLLREPVDQAILRLTGEATKFVLMREQPLQFHGQSLLTAGYDTNDYNLAMDYFSGLVSDILARQQLDKVEEARLALSQGLGRVARDFNGNTSVENPRELRDRYYTVASNLGSILLYSRILDQSVALYNSLSGDERLANWMRLDAYYNLACSLSLRSVSRSGAEARLADREAAARSLKECVRLGFDDWDLLKRDPDLEALHNHPDFIRIASGR